MTDSSSTDETNDRCTDETVERQTANCETDPHADDATGRRTSVREEYGAIAAAGDECCDAPDPSSGAERTDSDERARSLGYEDDDLADAPENSNMGLGCGNPVALSELEPGETVLDLGSGGGFDCFLASREVGPDGRVIGVDMTPEMLERARGNAQESEFDTVEFRLGEIEHLPVADASVDVVISNCVFNLSPDKPQVLAEAFRALRPGGRLSITDPVATEQLPAAVREDPDLINACVGDAATVDDIETWLADVGFVDVTIATESEWSEEYPIVSARIEARKPA
ncbi:arsenite methyltransferase [Natrialbaceae archaeon A-arb3/5]